MSYNTLTHEGLIPHLQYQWGEYLIDAPVKIRYREYGKIDAKIGMGVFPIRDTDGYLIYAAPGGGEIRHHQYAEVEA